MKVKELIEILECIDKSAIVEVDLAGEMTYYIDDVVELYEYADCGPVVKIMIGE